MWAGVWLAASVTWGSGTDKKLRRKCVPGSQLVPTPSPEARPPYHNPQHRTGQCTSLSDLRAERSGAGQNAMKGFGSSAISQKKNGYFRPDLAHIILGNETRLLLCVQRWQLFALVILTITFWSDATDEWLIQNTVSLSEKSESFK